MSDAPYGRDKKSRPISRSNIARTSTEGLSGTDLSRLRELAHLGIGHAYDPSATGRCRVCLSSDPKGKQHV